MALPHTLLTPVARFLRNVPTWALLVYFAVAVAMAVGLTAWFLASARTRQPNRPGGAAPAAVLLILFFPLMAISIIWPITLPIVVVVLLKELRKPDSRPHGFDVIPPGGG